MMEKVAILGDGAWGSALATVLVERGIPGRHDSPAA